ncbi:MAG: hypothetical protein ACLVLH_16450 [Eisenbergiella massiliensis]
MSKVYLMVTITGRGQGEQFAALNRTENLPVMMVALGKGTAGNEILDCLGLEGSEKIVLFSMVTGECVEAGKERDGTQAGHDVREWEFPFSFREQHRREKGAPAYAGRTGI